MSRLAASHSNLKHHGGQPQKVLTKPKIIPKGCCPQAGAACSLDETRWRKSKQHTRVEPSELRMRAVGWTYYLDLGKAALFRRGPNSCRKKQPLPAGWRSAKPPSVCETPVPLEDTDLPAEGKPFSHSWRKPHAENSKQGQSPHTLDSWHCEAHLARDWQTKSHPPKAACHHVAVCGLRMIFTFLNYRKVKLKNEQYFKMPENCMKFKFCCS